MTRTPEQLRGIPPEMKAVSKSFMQYLLLAVISADTPFQNKTQMVIDNLANGNLFIGEERESPGVDFMVYPVIESRTDSDWLSPPHIQVRPTITFNLHDVVNLSQTEQWVNFGYIISMAADWLSDTAVERKSTTAANALDLSIGFLKKLGREPADVLPDDVLAVYNQRDAHPDTWKEAAKRYVGIPDIEPDPDYETTHLYLEKYTIPTPRFERLYRMYSGNRDMPSDEIRELFADYQWFFPRHIGLKSRFKLLKIPVVEFFKMMPKSEKKGVQQRTQDDIDLEMLEHMLAQAMVMGPQLNQRYENEVKMEKMKETFKSALEKYQRSSILTLAEKAAEVAKHIDDNTLLFFPSNEIEGIQFEVFPTKDANGVFLARPALIANPDSPPIDIFLWDAMQIINLSQAADWFSGEFRWMRSQINATAYGLALEYLDSHNKLDDESHYPPGLIVAFRNRSLDPEGWLNQIKQLDGIDRVEQDIDQESLLFHLSRYDSGYIQQILKRWCLMRNKDVNTYLQKIPIYMRQLNERLTDPMEFVQLREKYRTTFKAEIENAQLELESFADLHEAIEHMQNVISGVIIDSELEEHLMDSDI